MVFESAVGRRRIPCWSMLERCAGVRVRVPARGGRVHVGRTSRVRKHGHSADGNVVFSSAVGSPAVGSQK